MTADEPVRKRAKKDDGDDTGGGKKKAASSKKKKSSAADEDEEMAEAAASSPKPKAKSQKKRSAAASSSASSARSVPFNCDSNSLSVILSFLGTRDFASSTSVSRQWRNVSGLHTAWPQPSIDSLIASLESDNYDDPAVRRLRIAPGRMFSARWDHVPKLLASRAYSQVNDIHFTTLERHSRKRSQWATVLASQRDPTQAAIFSLAQFPYLQTLNLCTTIDYIRDPYASAGPWLQNTASQDFEARFCEAFKDKLRALFLSTHEGYSGSKTLTALFAPELHRMTNLRVLVLDGELQGETLAKLQQLEFFHGRGFCYSPDPAKDAALFEAIRMLSVEHRLKAVSLVRTSSAGARVLSGKAGALKPAELTMLTLRECTLSTLDFQLLCEHLTHLKHLEVEWQPHNEQAWDERVALPGGLEVLKIVLSTGYHAGPQGLENYAQPFLPKCDSLRTFSLTAKPGGVWQCPLVAMSHEWLTTFVSSSFPHLHHLRIGDWTTTDRDYQVKGTLSASINPGRRYIKAPQPGAAAAAERSIADEEAKSDEMEEDAAAADGVYDDSAPFDLLATGCPNLESFDLQMHPQVQFSDLLPTIARLEKFHTLEATSHPSADHRGWRFTLPERLYTLIAQHPTFRTLRVHISTMQYHDPLQPQGHAKEVANSWSPDARYSDIPTVKRILNAVEKDQREAALERLNRFRLYRHAEKTGGRGSSVKVFSLEIVQHQPRWTWRKDEREE
jgi:hypothetical protein